MFSTLTRLSEAILNSSRKLKSDVNDLIWACNVYLLSFVRYVLCVALLMAGGVSTASSNPLAMPGSEVDYPGASASSAFVAMEPYVVNIQGKQATIPLWGASRGNDFSGNVPFINPKTGRADAQSMQAWDPVFAESFTPFLSGSYNLNGDQITNAGFPGRVDKRTINGAAATMVRYNAGDDVTEGTCRTKLNAYAVPPRTHVRWELEVAFGNADGVNDWALLPTGTSPVLFWQLKSDNQTNPPLQAGVDTDNLDPTKLMIYFGQRVGTATKPIEIARVHGIPRHTLTPVVIEAFLDERAIADGGKGLIQIWVNNTLAAEKAGPTLSLGVNEHWWSIDTYLWNDIQPSANTRAAFFKTARMLVFPVNTNVSADTAAPSAPSSLAATSPDSAKVNLSWSASTDNTGVAGYRIYRNNTEIGSSAVNSFTDTSTAGGTSYNYTVKAYDDSGNLSAASNTATVQTPKAINISSYYVGNKTATSATVNWTTNVSSTGNVYYGTNSGKLSSSVYDGALSTNHAKRITGLARRTTYYYKIVAKDAGNITASSPVSSFRTNK